MKSRRVKSYNPYPRKVGKVVTKVATPITRRMGFVKAAILLDWPKIVGEQFQKFCQPAKVSFPPNKKTNGRLYVKAPSSMATEISYLEPMILEKINAYFGYQAVTKIVIWQAPISTMEAKEKPGPKRKEIPPSDVPVDDIDDPELEAALIRLGQGVMGKS